MIKHCVSVNRYESGLPPLDDTIKRAFKGARFLHRSTTYLPRQIFISAHKVKPRHLAAMSMDRMVQSDSSVLRFSESQGKPLLGSMGIFRTNIKEILNIVMPELCLWFRFLGSTTLDQDSYLRDINISISVKYTPKVLTILSRKFIT